MKRTRPHQRKAEKKLYLPSIKVNYSILVPGFDMIRKHNESPIFRLYLTDEGYQVMALLERMSSTEIISSISIVGSTFQIVLVYFTCKYNYFKVASTRKNTTGAGCVRHCTMRARIFGYI
jgi:hypothetical protein